ncbi:MAG: hypothetical protein DWQ29_05055 [Planctomycetota bacterium]|nr:MAG: hypothetical protein DWQ29_05055 [Planctomycetota bacterium]
MRNGLLGIDELSRLDSGDLRQIDIALLNLAAAQDLPGIGDCDVSGVLQTLDDWAERVKLEVWRHLYRFEEHSAQPPTEFSFGNSLGRFFCWFLLQVLQEDCGVAYHPGRKFNPDFCQPQDLFIHGIVGKNGQGGTCASMPVVYVAVGRRLGLPVHLVEARGHLLFRWDDPHGTTIDWDGPNVRLWIPPDRFNVEGSGEGIAFYPDAHYIQWPEMWTEQDFEHGRYLHTMSATEDLAAFLVQRAECFYEAGDWNGCLKAIAMARHLVPEDLRYEWLHARRTLEWQDHEDRLARIEQENRRRRRERQSLPGLPHHARNCCCIDCERMREKRASIPAPPHGESCQCLHCKQAREARTQAMTAAIPGHPPGCTCYDCTQARRAVGPGLPTSPFPPLPGPAVPSHPHITTDPDPALPGW